MSTTFANSLKALRTAKGLSQQQLAMKLFVDRSTVARWELGERIPDLVIVPRIAECLGVESATLLNVVQADEPPRVIVVDDERNALLGAIALLEKALPEAAITGFNRPSDALVYAQAHPVDIAFLDIEMQKTNGLDLCQKILETCPKANVVFLTAYREYSLDAWKTGACGFMLKPITIDGVLDQVDKLRHPVVGLSNMPSNTPDSMPSNMPSNMPDSTPDSALSSMPDSAPSSTPSSTPDSTPDSMPSNMPSSTPSNTPSSTPDSAPSSTPDSAPSSTPDSQQQAVPN